MLGTPQFGDVPMVDNVGLVGATVTGTAVPEGGTTNTYGAVTEIISAANNNIGDCWGIHIRANETGASAAASQACLDILIGGATDDVLISSLLVGGTYAASPREFFFPLHIPTGVRIAAQLSSVRTAIADPQVSVMPLGGPPPMKVGHKVTTYGTKIDNSRGQAITPTASGGAASIAQLTASTTDDHFYFLPGFQASTDTTLNGRNYNIGIGVGAATEERIGTWIFEISGGEHQHGPWPPMGAFREVPSGTRLTMLASNSGTNDAAYDGLIYAVS